MLVVICSSASLLNFLICELQNGTTIMLSLPSRCGEAGCDFIFMLMVEKWALGMLVSFESFVAQVAC